MYLGRYNGAPLAIKVYRLYRTSHRGGRPIKPDSMGWRAAHEFEMLRQAWKGGAPVPAPGRRVEHRLAMRYLGGEAGPAPRLHDVRLDDAGAFLDAVLDGVRRLTRSGIVHGDLSAFNVLVHDGEPWFIDLAESFRVDRLGTAPWQQLTQASEVLDHGLRAIAAYFRRYRLDVDVAAIRSELVASLDARGVLR